MLIRLITRTKSHPTMLRPHVIVVLFGASIVLMLLQHNIIDLTHCQLFNRSVVHVPTAEKSFRAKAFEIIKSDVLQPRFVGHWRLADWLVF